MSLQEFAKFHADSLNQMSPRLNFDALTINLARHNQKGLPDGEIVSAVANTPRSVIANYGRHIHLDEFTPLTFLQPGSAVFVDAVTSMENWASSAIYKIVCSPYDFHWVLGVSYVYPFHTKSVVAIDYMCCKENAFANDLEEFEVEYLTFPYFLGWLFQFGAIDAQTLRLWLSHIANMPPARFRVVRGLAERKAFNARSFSKAIGCSQKTVYRHLEIAFEELVCRNNELASLDGTSNRILALSNAYRFFEFGTASVSRTLPLRRPKVTSDFPVSLVG
ncbi:MAG: hypothetical protein ABJ358_09745 [Rhizobiaceae bacterium]